MAKLIVFSRKAAYFLTAITAGLCLFVLFFALTAGSTVMNPGFHERLIDKSNISAETHKGLKNSVSAYIRDLEKSKSRDKEQQTAIFSILDKTITPEMVEKNLDSIREGLFQYLRGERKFLPDIYIDAKDVSLGESFKGIYGSGSLPVDSISGVNKISLNTILQYINREDINDYALFLKLVYYLTHAIPGFMLLALLLLSLVGLLLSKSFMETVRWIAAVLLTCAASGILGAAALLVYSYAFLPGSIYPIGLTLPLGNNVILTYIRGCLSPFTILFIVEGLLLSALFAGYVLLKKKVFSGKPLSIGNTGIGSAAGLNRSLRARLNSYAYLLILAVIISVMGYRLYSFRDDFERNNFPAVLDKMRNANAVTEVIAARDEAIYTLQVKVIGSESGEPIPNTQINVSGKDMESENNYNITAATNEEGVARFELSKGDFRLSFIEEAFPSGYKVPSPFFFEMETAGTTVITSKLEVLDESDILKLGIVEVEVLDQRNGPVPGVELTTEGEVPAQGYPDILHSFTDSEGIASFKVSEGSYRIGAVEASFPPAFSLPPSIDVKVTHDLVTRYTIRLADKPEQNPQN